MTKPSFPELDPARRAGRLWGAGITASLVVVATCGTVCLVLSWILGPIVRMWK